MRSMRHLASMGLLIATISSSPAFASVRAFTDPRPVSLPPGTSYRTARTVLLRGLANEKWWIVSHSRGHISALKVAPLDREAMIDIDYGAQQIVIRYLRSSNLLFSSSAGRQVIDSEYSDWIHDLVDTVKDQLSVPSLLKKQ